MENRQGQNVSDQEAAELLLKLLKGTIQQNESNAGSVAKTVKGGPDPIDLIGLFWRILSKWFYILGAAIAATALMFVYLHYNFVPVYSATAKLYIIADSDAVINVSSLQVGTLLTNDYTEVFKTWQVHEMVRESLGLDYSYSKMQSMISVSNNNSSRVLNITVRNSDPQLACDIANAYAVAARTFITSVMKTDEPTNFSMALVPSTPTGSSKSKMLIMAFLAGTFIALFIIVLQYLLDDRPRTPEDITSISTLPVLGVIPVNDPRNRKVYGGKE